MDTSDRARPETMVLTDRQKSRVLRRLSRRRSVCRGCGTTDFLVGDALYLGFLFLQEATDAYMVALTCTNPRCPTPHNGVRLRRPEIPSA